MPLTDEQMVLYNETRRWHSSNGRPKEAQLLRTAMLEDTPLDDETAAAILIKDIPVEQRSYDPTMEIPPRHGPGSGTKAWQRFARQHSDFDVEIIADASKRDLIGMLEANGIIPRLQDEADSE